MSDLLHEQYNKTMSFRTNNMLSTYERISGSASFFASPRYAQTSGNAHLK